tara:strand:+ start:266 stop:1123 length:858 start_codon:yes stop_codon:yes gene_type:complete
VERQDQRIGLLSALPMGVVLLISFLAPMLVIAVFSVMPQKVFSLLHIPDFSSYKLVFTQGYIKSVLWSFGMAMASTVVLFVICWPLAFGMAKVFKGFGIFITIAVVVTLFVSENIRLFGWVLTLMKGGLIEGHLRAWTGLTFEGVLYNTPVIVFGLVYAYFPFMLFPLIQGIAMVPDDARQAAADLGATRRQIFFEVDLPLSAPGIVIGSLLSFVLAAGAMAESKLLGGQTVIVIADEIETAFTYGQNWPLGSALSIILILVIGALSIFGINRVNLDLIMGGRRT